MTSEADVEKVVYRALRELRHGQEHIKEILRDIKLELRNLKLRLQLLERPQPIYIPPDKIEAVLLALPDHLRRSMLAITRLSEGTAADVAELTKRKRAVESSYLNQLVMMGKMRKKRRGKTVVFYI